MRKSLRLGLVVGDRLIDERLVRGARAVSLGDVGERPAAWKVLVPAGQGWRLRLAPGMEARVADAKGTPAAVTGPTEVPLSPTSRGKVLLGEATLLFQLVAAPPPAPRPQLPRSLRRPLSSRIDPVLAGILVFSLLVHGGVGAWVYGLDLPRRAEAEEMPARFTARTIPIPKPVPASPPATSGEPAAATPGPATPAPSKATTKAGGSSTASVKEFDPRNTALLKVLGRKGDGDGRFFDVTGGKDLGGDLARSLEHGRDHGFATPTTPDLATPTGPRDISGGSMTGPVGPSDPTGVGPRKETPITAPDIDVERPETLGGIDPAEVMDTIKRRYFRNISDCYRLSLKKDHKASGKLILTLGIGSSGRVTKASVTAFDPDLAQCVEDRARTWRFATGQDGDEVEIPILLRPGS